MTLYVLVDFVDENIEFSERKWQVVLEESASSDPFKILLLSASEIQDYQHKEHEIWLVLSAKVCSFYTIQIPKVSTKDILPAIGSILEDGLTQDFSDYHCFYQPFASGKTLVLRVGLIDKHIYTHLMYQWQSHGVSISGVTVDWLALNDNEFLLLPSAHALVNTEELKGYLLSSRVNQILEDLKQSTQVFYFDKPEITLHNGQLLAQDFPIWLISRLKLKGLFDISMRKKRLNLLESMPRTRVEYFFIRACVGLFTVSLLGFSFFFIRNSTEYFHNKKIMSTYTQEATDDLEHKLSIYQAHQTQKNKFWSLFISLQKAMVPGIHLENFTYEQEHLKCALTASDMSILQNFKRRLSQAHLSLQESQVLVENEGIKATIELRGHP
jgi:hypothetical protein